MWTAFDYMYRDAGNFKAFGTIVLDDPLSAADEELIRSRLSGLEFFIAEQVGVPPLYKKLYRWSGGPTNSDHCWHEFVGFREVPISEEKCGTVTVEEFVGRFTDVKGWNEELSPHFALGGGLMR